MISVEDAHELENRYGLPPGLLVGRLDRLNKPGITVREVIVALFDPSDHKLSLKPQS